MQRSYGIYRLEEECSQKSIAEGTFLWNKYKSRQACGFRDAISWTIPAENSFSASKITWLRISVVTGDWGQPRKCWPRRGRKLVRARNLRVIRRQWLGPLRRRLITALALILR